MRIKGIEALAKIGLILIVRVAIIEAALKNFVKIFAAPLTLFSIGVQVDNVNVVVIDVVHELVIPNLLVFDENAGISEQTDEPEVLKLLLHLPHCHIVQFGDPVFSGGLLMTPVAALRALAEVCRVEPPETA